MQLSTDQRAGVLYALPAIAVIGAWVMLLLVHNPPPAKPLEVLFYLLSESPSLMWLRWFLVLPLLYVTLSALYFTRTARHRVGAVVLFAVGALTALLCWVTVDVWLAVVATVPVFFSYLSVREKFVTP